jgi:hypothetical protein
MSATITAGSERVARRRMQIGGEPQLAGLMARHSKVVECEVGALGLLLQRCGNRLG